MSSIVTTLLIQAIDKISGLDRGASMGVVFTTLFAIGLILIRQAADQVDLDPGCVLYGAIELTPLDTATIFGHEIPNAVVTNGAMLIANLAFVVLFYKELKITSFDPALATTIGINASLMHYLLMTLVAATTIAAFESVGSILVIAMLIVPGAAAHLLTDRMGRMLAISLVFAALSAILGHIGAITVPRWFGFQDTSTAGMMAVAAGVLFLLVLFFAPRYGIISRLLRQLQLGMKIIGDDVLGFLFRYQELAAEGAAPVAVADVRSALKETRAVHWVIGTLRRKGLVRQANGGLALTPSGMDAGKKLVRAHRLWETYLCDRMGFCETDVHRAAHKLEHVTDEAMTRALKTETGDPAMDPHQRAIP